MASESKTEVPDFVEQAPAMLVITPPIAPQMEQLWKAQDQILEETEHSRAHGSNVATRRRKPRSTP